MRSAFLNHFYWHDPKFYRLPARAERLWTRALAYADYHLMDGLIPASALDHLDATPADAATLTAAGLWHRHPTGWRIDPPDSTDNPALILTDLHPPHHR